MPGTVQLHRVISAPPERVFRAFTDGDALVKWLPPHGFTAKLHSIDMREGGGYKMSFTNFTSKNGHSFSAKYIELKTNERLKYVNRFDDPNLPGEMTVTVSLKKVLCGTELKITQEGIPDAIPVE